MSIDTGGPAFPAPDFAVSKAVSKDALMRLGDLQGMALRDWFAGMAIQGIGSQPDYDPKPEQLVSYAYAIADAMIAQRKRKVP